VPRRTGHIAIVERRPTASPLGVALAVLALCLRLVWPAPPSVGSADITALTGLGEHALCLAASANADAPPIGSDRAPAPIGDHADHDHSLCCLWHAAAGFLVPQVAAVARIAFAELAAAAAAPPEFHPAGLIGPTRARGPPALG
jgi:hypothetical protein